MFVIHNNPVVRLREYFILILFTCDEHIYDDHRPYMMCVCVFGFVSGLLSEITKLNALVCFFFVVDFEWNFPMKHSE